MDSGESLEVKVRLKPTCERLKLPLGLVLRYTRSLTRNGNEPYKAREADGLIESEQQCESKQQ